MKIDWDYYHDEVELTKQYGYDVPSLIFPTRPFSGPVTVWSWSPVRQRYNLHMFPEGFSPVITGL